MAITALPEQHCACYPSELWECCLILTSEAPLTTYAGTNGSQMSIFTDTPIVLLFSILCFSKTSHKQALSKKHSLKKAAKEENQTVIKEAYKV